MKTLAVRFAFIAVLLVSTCASAMACSCVGSEPACEAAWLQADAVFIGRVYWSSSGMTKNVYGQQVMRRSVTIKVLEPFVGNQQGWITVDTGMGGGDCGFNFVWFVKYVVYAHRNKDGTLETSICTRTKTVSEASEELEYLRSIKYRENEGRVYGRVSQYTFEPKFTPAKESKVSRDSLDFEEQFAPMHPLAGTVVRLKSGKDGSERNIRAAENGDFSFENLPPGPYVFSVDLPSVMAPYGPIDITVPAKGCYMAKVGTAYNGRVEGRVSNSEGAGISYADVEIVRAEDAENAERAFRWTTAKKDGTFLIGPLPPGDYFIGVRITKYSGERKLAKTYYPGVSDLRNAKRVSLREGQLVEGLDFRVHDKQAD
jgi:hypothetical protein